MANRGPLFVSAYTHFLALPFLLVFTSGSFYAKLPSLGAQVWIAVLFLAIFCTFLGYIFYNRALPILGATATSTYSYLVPVLALFFSWLILKEQINWFIALGAMLVISGVAITNWALQFRNRPPAEVANKGKILKKEGLPTDEARSRLGSS